MLILHHALLPLICCHRHWTAFGMAASTAGYVFLYSIHYFVYKTRMTGAGYTKTSIPSHHVSTVLLHL
jgi:hypothetical protein